MQAVNLPVSRSQAQCTFSCVMLSGVFSTQRKPPGGQFAQPWSMRALDGR